MNVKQLSNLIQALACRLGRDRRVSTESKLSDSSLEDASFDAEMRSFFRAEYGKALPPDDISVHLVRAIRLYHEKASRRASGGFTVRLIQSIRKLALVPRALYRIGSHPHLSRMLSGSVLAALLVMTIAPKMVQSLNRNGTSSIYSPRPGEVSDFWSPARMEKAANAGLVNGLTDDLVTPVLTTAPQRELSVGGIGAEQSRLLLQQKIGEDIRAPVFFQVEQFPGLHPLELGLAPEKSSKPQPGEVQRAIQ